MNQIKTRIGIDFHSVANDVYASYDEGLEPSKKQLKELYELSKEYVKDYEETEEANEVEKNIKLNRELYLQNQKANPDDTI